jgi:hypothetical protein
MTPRFALCLTLALAALSACEKAAPSKAVAMPLPGLDSAPPNEDASEEDACTSDNCVVPLADLGGVCGPTLKAATMDCRGTTVSTGPCGALTHVSIKTVQPRHDCYYDAASGALVGGIVRSDSGFTKIAGTIPSVDCPVDTEVCDHVVAR